MWLHGEEIGGSVKVIALAATEAKDSLTVSMHVTEPTLTRSMLT